MIHTSAPHVLTLAYDGLGDRSYVAHDGSTALVVDPQRDVDQVERLLAEHGLRLSHVLETHIHNDYVSGGLVLAKAHGATYVVPLDAGVALDARGVSDGDTFDVGSLTVSVIATPGHTPHHVAYSVHRGEHPGSVFTGGSMLYGAVGRPDLVRAELTTDLTKQQWHSVQRLAGELASATHVYPTHGFGSFCAATQNEGKSGTVADEWANNPALTQAEDAFVESTLGALDVFPSYYAHMGPANAEGADSIDLSLPLPADAAELQRRIARGEWVVDLRSREVFSCGHVPGSMSFDLDGPFVTYLAWMIPWGTPVTLLGGTIEQVAAAQRELVRVGIDRPVAHAVGDASDWTASIVAPGRHVRVDFADLARRFTAGEEIQLLDVRQLLEYEDGHVRAAQHIPFYDLMDRLAEVPRTDPLYVYCGSGYRAAASVSLLMRAGFDNVVHVDDEWDNVASTTLPIEHVQAEPRPSGWTWTESRRTARHQQSESGKVSA